jgi:hypothetical protein
VGKVKECKKGVGEQVVGIVGVRETKATRALCAFRGLLCDSFHFSCQHFVAKPPSHSHLLAKRNIIEVLILGLPFVYDLSN